MQHFPIAYNQSHEGIISNFFAFLHLQPDVFQCDDQAAYDAEQAFCSIVQSGLQTTKGFWMDADDNDGQDLG